MIPTTSAIPFCGLKSFITNNVGKYPNSLLTNKSGCSYNEFIENLQSFYFFNLKIGITIIPYYLIERGNCDEDFRGDEGADRVWAEGGAV